MKPFIKTEQNKIHDKMKQEHLKNMKNKNQLQAPR